MKTYTSLLIMVVYTLLADNGYAQQQVLLGNIRQVKESYSKIAENIGGRTSLAEVTYPLAGQASLILRITSTKKAGAADLFFGNVANDKLSNLYVNIMPDNISGSIIMREQKKLYHFITRPGGLVYLEEQDIDKKICTGLPLTTDADYNNKIKRSKLRVTTPAPATPAVPLLESLPGAGAVVYLDFDGQTVSNTGWNMFFNNGNPIEAASCAYTETEMTEIWKLISEDFRPFAVNVTTSEAVYNNGSASRTRVIFTPTNNWYPNSGGVAFIGTFLSGTSSGNNDICWVFNLGVKAGGETGSHEAGHTMHLLHDGRTTPAETYFYGQGAWAPIMGAGFNVPVVQWSKGEYANANQSQDDLNTITSYNGFGYRTDDHANNIGNATPIVFDANGAINPFNNKGLISGTSDIDFFSFSTPGGKVGFFVNADPFYPNLDIVLTLRDANGTVLATEDPPTMAASINLVLPAGTYYLSVDGTAGALGADSDYGSLGSYAISGPAYCIPTYSTACSSADIINHFSFHTLLNDHSGCSSANGVSYTVYPPTGNLTTSVNRGQSYTMSMQSGPQYAQGFGVWIDFNLDKDFDDPGEFVYASPSNSTGLYTTVIDIPWTAILGETRLRVRCKYESAVSGSEHCSLFAFGEAEDYTITISGVNAAPTVSISAPVNGAIFLSPADIVISAHATDAAGAVEKVEFFNGANKLGEDLEQPYQLQWNGVVAGSYTISARATDNEGFVGFSTPVELLIVPGSGCPGSGTITREYWPNTSGSSISAIPLNTPPATETFLSAFEAATNQGDNYGQRIRGFLCAPVTGSYAFYIASDNNSELWLSTGDNPAAKQKIAFVTGATVPRGWTKYPSQKSAAINLQAGTRYYIEALHKESTGNDNLAVGWKIPGSNVIAVVPGSALSAYANPTNGSPIVSITSPSDGATFVAPANVVIKAAAADFNGSITKVEFYHGTLKLGQDEAFPYQFDWSGIAAGNYAITAKATDNDGLVTTSGVVVINVLPNAPPALTITTPANGASYTAPANIMINVTASDATGSISTVEFYDGETRLGEDKTAPYQFNLPYLQYGTYLFKAKAIDYLGLSTTSEVVSAVVNPGTAPTVNITSPLNGTNFPPPASITIQATAADIGSPIAKVEFFADAATLGEDATEPYSYNWTNVAEGTYVLTAKATSVSGAATLSNGITITVKDPFYCLPATQYGCIDFDYVNNFSFHTLVNNGSGCSNVNGRGYTNYLPSGTFTTSVSRGQSYSMSMQAGQEYEQGFGVWIDFNADKDFDDAGEFVYQSPTFSKDVFTAIINIPPTAHLGLTRLRIRSKYSALIFDNEVCSVIEHGEAEDYSITITDFNAAPTIEITSPTNGATFVAPATINISVNADDPDGSVEKVEFFNGTTWLAEDVELPFQYTWSSVPQGTYQIVARATDNLGLVTVSAGIPVTVTPTTGCTATGSILREYWAGLAGATVASIPITTTPMPLPSSLILKLRATLGIITDNG